MDQILFEEKFSNIMKKLDAEQSSYNFQTIGESWDNFGTNPLDIAFTELSELYLEADTTQREIFYEQAAIAKLPNNLWYFIPTGQADPRKNSARTISSPQGSIPSSSFSISSATDGRRSTISTMHSSPICFNGLLNTSMVRSHLRNTTKSTCDSEKYPD